MCTYLLKRDGGMYYFRRGIPAELRPALGGKREFLISLRTKDRETAKRLNTAHALEADRKLDEAARRLAQEASQSTLDVPEEGPPSLALEDAQAVARVGEEIALARERAEQRQEARREARRRLRAEMEAHAENFSTADLSPYHAILKDILAERAEFANAFQPLSSRAPPEPSRGAAVPILETYDAYAAEADIKPRTRDAWRRVMERLIAFLGHDDAARITADDLDRWRDTLAAEELERGGRRSARTLRYGYIAAIRAMLEWAKRRRKVRENVAADVTVHVKKRTKLRDRDFTDAEANAILSAALKEASSGSPEQRFALRWIPWLCAYTGARVNEISQLRGEDVQERDGVCLIRITPEAGTVKADAARLVPLHPHLLEQGFPEAAKARGEGPLFYSVGRSRSAKPGNTQARKVGERLAAWVRKEVGITDPNLAPNHGWRHTFKTRAIATDMPERIADAIQGHAAKSVGRTYGSVPLATMALAIARMPRFQVQQADATTGEEG